MATLVSHSKQRVSVRRPQGVSPDLLPGDSLSLTLGGETYSPVKYFTFVVGPITGTTVVQNGETGDTAFVRLSASLLAMFEVEFATKCEQFLGRLRDVVAYAGANKASR